MDVFKMAWRNVWRNKLRSGIMIGSMIFGLLGVMLMVGFVQAMVDSMVDNAIKYQSGHIQIHSPAFLLNEEIKAWLPEADPLAEQVRHMAGVAGVSVRQVVDGMIGSAAATRGVRINGINVSDEARVTAIEDNIVEGATLPDTGRNPILVGQRLGGKLKLRIKSKVVLTFSDIHGEVTGAAFRVCGFFKTPSSEFDEGYAFVRRTDMALLTGIDEAHEIAILLSDDEAISKVKKDTASLVGDKGLVQDWQEIQPLLAAMVSSMGISNAIVIGIFVLALGFGIVNIMFMSVFERTREFGMLMAIGMNNKKVSQLVALEAIFLGGIGSLCGMIASAIMIGLTGHFGLPFGAMAEGLGAFGVDTVLYPTVPFVFYPIVVGIILFTSFLSALYPIRSIVKKQPSEALAEKH